MVVCQSDTSLVKSVVSSSSSSSSSFDNGESDCDTVCTENTEGMATNSSYNQLAPERSNDAVATFENISVCNSTDIHFGNKTFYNGPVTIKQFVYSAEETPRDCVVSSDKEGNINIARTFRKLSGSEVLETTCTNSSVAFVHNSDLKATNGGQTQSSSECTPQENNKIDKGLQTRYFPCCGLSLRYFLMATAVVLVTVLLIVLTVMVLKYEKKDTNDVVSSPETVMRQPTDDNFTLSGKLRIMQRSEWLAQPLAAPLPVLTTPVPYVIISHTATEHCISIAQCILLVRTVQTFHLESRGWWDIGYNFLVGGDGFAYIGRGWDSVGAHAYGYNNVSIGISFMGTFNNVLPPERQLKAAKQLIELGVQLGKISENYKLLAHRQVSATESPGAVLFQELKKWPHWAPAP